MGTLCPTRYITVGVVVCFSTQIVHARNSDRTITMEAAHSAMAGSLARDRSRRDNAGRAAVRYTPYGRGGCGPEFMRAVGLGVVAGFVGCGISAPLLVRLALWLGLSTCLTYYIASSVFG